VLAGLLIVALSGLDADPCSPFCYAVSYGYTEHLLAGSGCLVSITRASIYSEFFTGFLARARASDQVRLPAAYGRISLVSRADVARCLAALAVRPAGGCHDITGPESLDLAAVSALAAREWGTALEYAGITPAGHCAEMATGGGSLVDICVLDDVRLRSGNNAGQQSPMRSAA
jgi:NAD(P)H dehydrogenase (quinone)